MTGTSATATSWSSGATTATRRTWTVQATDDGACTLTIDAVQSMPWLQGVVMKRLLRHLFYGINFTPFIEEAERRARAYSPSSSA
jgi:hypothetical protein